MKILRLTSENIKKLIAVEITPEGNVVEITGKNGAGKTSVLDSIYWALSGLDTVQSAPIRQGQKNAKIVLRLSGERELVVTRKFARKDEGGFTTSLTVESADGAKFSSPQTMLDQLLGTLSFDPLAFARMKPAEQFDSLKRFVPDFDFAQTELDQKADYDRRTAISRQAREAAAAAEAIVVPVETPEEPVDETALAAELEDAGKKNTELEQRKGRRDYVREEIADLERRIGSHDSRIEQIKRELQESEDSRTADLAAVAAKKKQLDEAPPLPDPVETTEIRHRMDAARLTNTNVSRLAERKRMLARAAELEAQAEEITARREARDEAKRKAIAAAKMPVEGLDFGAGVVLLNGQPFDQASDAEQLHTSVAIAAAMAGTLRVIRIRDGSLLDSDGMKCLADFAVKHDLQIWLEKVSDGGGCGIIIEDGRLKQHGIADLNASSAA